MAMMDGVYLMMKLKTLIQELESVSKIVEDDATVYVGEGNGNFLEKISVNVRQSNVVIGEADDFSKVVIIQGYLNNIL